MDVNDRVTRTVYFAEPGPQNTDATLAESRRCVDELGLEYVVVATDTGRTAHKALEAFPGKTVIVVTNQAGLFISVSSLHDYLPRFQKHKAEVEARGKKQVSAALNEGAVFELEKAGGRVLRVDWDRLRAFVKGSTLALDKVAVAVRVGLTCAAWAYLAERVPADAEVLCIAGTGFGGGGADTAIVVRTAKDWRDFRILEVVAKPRVGPPSERG